MCGRPARSPRMPSCPGSPTSGAPMPVHMARSGQMCSGYSRVCFLAGSRLPTRPWPTGCWPMRCRWPPLVGVMGPWLELPDSLDPLAAETAGVGYVNALPDSLALAFADQVLTPAGLPMTVARELTRGLERFLVLVAFGVYLLWESRRVWS